MHVTISCASPMLASSNNPPLPAISFPCITNSSLLMQQTIFVRSMRWPTERPATAIAPNAVATLRLNKVPSGAGTSRTQGTLDAPVVPKLRFTWQPSACCWKAGVWLSRRYLLSVPRRCPMAAVGEGLRSVPRDSWPTAPRKPKSRWPNHGYQRHQTREAWQAADAWLACTGSDAAACTVA